VETLSTDYNSLTFKRAYKSAMLCDSAAMLQLPQASRTCGIFFDEWLTRNVIHIMMHCRQNHLISEVIPVIILQSFRFDIWSFSTETA